MVEQFLVARIALYETVYCHRTVRAAEGMVKNLLRRLKEVAQAEQIPGPAVFTKAIAGQALSQSELLGLDDFALFVLIEQLASGEKVDPVVRDLARRILSRDLFKLVPVSPDDRVQEFLSEENGYDMLYDAIRPFCPGNPRDYVVRDDYSVTFLNEDLNESNGKSPSYLIDSFRRAKPLREHSDLKAHKEGIKKTRIFTLEACLPAARKAIMGAR